MPAEQIRRLTVIGTIPPPTGGVSVHVSRLTSLASSRGWLVQLIDVHPNHQKPTPRQSRCLISTFGFRPVLALMYWWHVVTNRKNILHYHASRLTVFLLLNLPLLLLPGTGRRILTLHSGETASELNQYGPLLRRLLRYVLKKYDVIIAVANEISVAIDAYLNPGRRSLTIPAFIAPAETSVPSTAHRYISSLPIDNVESARIICSGYGTDLYNWEEVAEAIGHCPKSWQWMCCFYTTFDQEYYRRIRTMLDRYPNVTCFENLGMNDFLRVLACGTVFLRPTKTDGDAISVREALAFGVSCVASNVVSRPEGVRLYPLGDVASLCRTLSDSVREKTTSKITYRDFGGTIMEVYEALWTGISR